MTGEKSLAYKLIDRRIDDYIAYRIAKAKKNTKQEKVEGNFNWRHPKSSSEGVPIFRRQFKRQYNNDNKGILKTIKERRSNNNAAQADAIQ